MICICVRFIVHSTCQKFLKVCMDLYTPYNYSGLPWYLSW